MKRISDAMRAMVNREFIDTSKYREQQHRAVREGGHPDIIEFEKRLVTRARKQWVPLFCHCLMRGKAEQDRVRKEGFSKVPYGRSAHNYGMAVDIIHGVKGWELHKTSWSLIGHIGHEISVQSGIEVNWGGDDGTIEDKFRWDPAHWELKHWRLNCPLNPDWKDWNQWLKPKLSKP